MKNNKLSVTLLSLDTIVLVVGISLLVAGIINQLGYSLYTGALMTIYSIWLGWKIWKERRTTSE